MEGRAERATHEPDRPARAGTRVPRRVVVGGGADSWDREGARAAGRRGRTYAPLARYIGPAARDEPATESSPAWRATSAARPAPASGS